MKTLQGVQILMFLVFPVTFSCSSFSAGAGAKVAMTSPDYMLIHSNPQSGDYAVYRVDDSSGRSYAVTTEVLTVRQGVIHVRSTDGLNVLNILCDRNGKIIRYGEPGAGWAQPLERTSHFGEEKVDVSFNGKTYMTKPFQYSWRMDYSTEYSFGKGSSSMSQLCTAYSADGVMFRTLAVKAETVMVTGSEIDVVFSLLASALKSASYLMAPQNALGKIISPEGIASFVAMAADKAAVADARKHGIEVTGSVMSGDFQMKMQASYSMILVEQGRKTVR
jgi:hypothetical protein